MRCSKHLKCQLIGRRRDSSRSFASFTRSQTRLMLQEWISQFTHRVTHTQAHKHAQFLLGEKRGLAEMIGIFHDSSACEDEASSGRGTDGSESQRALSCRSHATMWLWSHQTGSVFRWTRVCTPTRWQKEKKNLFFMHNSVSEIWQDEEMVSSFPEH